jgi:L-arabinokinase
LKHPEAPRIAFYISGHGYGHASRQIELLNALGARRDAIDIIIRTGAARWLFDRTLKTPATLLPGECDTGIVQIDSLRLDEPATVRSARAFYDSFEERVTAEASLLRTHAVELVIADAPPLACAAAAALGIPAIVIGNFTWDWIYEAYEPRFCTDAPDVLPLIRDAYSLAREAWRLPMHGGFVTFRSVVDLPFIARHATRPSAAVLETLTLPCKRPLALSSFGGYGVDRFDPRTLDCLDDWTIVITGRSEPSGLPSGVAFVNEDQLYASGLRYEDLVAAVDVVVTKPGYGIISECVANETALLYTSRGRFPEYDVMVREMPRVLRCAYIEQDALLAGRWRDALDRLRSSPEPEENPPTNGAEVAADRILRML